MSDDAGLAQRSALTSLVATVPDHPGHQGEPGVPNDPHGPAGAPRTSIRVMFLIIAAALFMSSLDLTIVATAIPAIHKSLRASINWVGWTITIYGLFTVVALPIAGQLSSRFGRRRVFVIGVTTFMVASLACGLSSSLAMLIPLRAVQALGGGAIQPSAAGLIADNFGDQRGKAIGLFGVVSSAGQLVGPIVGGILIAYASWRWVFYVNVPIGVILLVCTFVYLPESPNRTPARTDLLGLGLMATTVFAAVLGATLLGDAHTRVGSVQFLVPEALAFIFGISFVVHSNRAEAPFIPLRLLRGRGFAVMNGINLLHGMVTFGVASLVPLYAENRYHLPVLKAGTLLTSRAVGMIIVGGFAAMALRRTGYRLPMMGGFAVVALGNALMSIAPRFGLSPFVWLSVCVGIAGLGLGAVNPAASNACLHLAPDQVAAITGLRSMFINLGVIVSVSITTAILNRSSDPAITQSHVLWVAGGVIVVVLIPLVLRVPEHRGDW